MSLRWIHVLVVVLSGLAAAGCGGGLLGQDYEYEEEVRLDVDGSARVDLHASVPALVALRGVDLRLGPDDEVDRDAVRRLFEGAGVEVGRIRTSRRNGRRFVHVRLDVGDIRQLSRLAPFAWSSYGLSQRGEVIEFRQMVGESASRDVGDVGWDGSELVAFRMHIPSVILFHNAPSREVQRGNILEWEQPLVERLKGTPVDVQVNMESESILYSTLLLFGATIVLAGMTFGVVIWRVARSGRSD